MEPPLSVHLGDNLLCKQQEQPLGCWPHVSTLWDVSDDIISVHCGVRAGGTCLG